MVLFKVVILGDGGVGKSALVIQMVQNRFVQEYDPTIENSFRKQIVVDDEPFLLDILDTAGKKSFTKRCVLIELGQEEFSALRNQYIRTADGFVIVYSICDRKSFNQAKEIYQIILDNKEAEIYPIVLLGNKSDLESEREEEAKHLAEEILVPFFETSAKRRENVDESFIAVVREIKKAMEKNSPNESYPATLRNQKKSKKCTIL